MTSLESRTAQVPEPRSARGLRGFGPLGLLAILVILAGSVAGPILMSLLVLLWARLSRTPMRALGFRRPRRWAWTLLGSALFGIAFKLAMKSAVMPLLGAPPVNAAYHFLAGNTAMLPTTIAAILFSAGFGEEVFFRGYLFERLGALLGPGRLALAFTLLFSASLFGVAHWASQGLPGVQQATVTGLVFGGIYAWRRQLWVLMVAHVMFDLTAVVLIYWNLETAVAHWLFR